MSSAPTPAPPDESTQRGAPFGRFSLYLGMASERTFDQLARQGFAGRQSNPVTAAETWTQ